jgi:NADH-quinone oxidoreductase subunit L
MMLGLGVGGVAVGLFHLLTHAFFKALLFLGAGSVIHGCHDEQDIRRMGGLRRFMPVTFATYAVGMMALAGVIPLAGFWSKDGILHAAHAWSPSHGPFFLGLFGALVTAFYMTRQVCYVFLGERRAGTPPSLAAHREAEPNAECGTRKAEDETRNAECAMRNGKLIESQAYESPKVMTVPLVVLAVFAALMGFLGTPMWPWLQTYLDAGHGGTTLGQVIPLMLISTVVAAAGIGIGWVLYGQRPPKRVESPDVLDRLRPAWFRVLRERFFVDELYEATVVRLTARFCRFCHSLDAMVLEGLVTVTAYLVLGVSWLARLVDEYAVNLGFDRGCERLRAGGGFVSRLQDGQIQNDLRALGVSLTVFLLLLLWGCR